MLIPVLIESLLLASGGIVSVGSITLVILLLISDKGWRNGLGYMLGYTISYSLIGIIVVLVGFSATDNNVGEPGKFLPVLFIILGTMLLWLTQRNWVPLLTLIHNAMVVFIFNLVHNIPLGFSSSFDSQ